MNTQTIEVEIDASGQVHAVDPQVAIPAGPALLTPLGSQHLAAMQGQAPQRSADWRTFVGVLSGSPSWREEPQTIQDRMRDEWRR